MTGTGGFWGGGQTYNAVNFTNNSSVASIIINGNNTFSSLSLSNNTRTTTVYYAFRVQGNQTCTSSFIASTTSAAAQVLIIGDPQSATERVTISSPSVTLVNAGFGNIIAAGTAAPFTGTRIGDLGGNQNITTDAPKTVYWNQPAGGNYTDAAWALGSGGSVSADNFPLPQDTAVLENTGLNTSATITVPANTLFNGIDTSTRTNAATLTVPTTGLMVGKKYNFSSPNVTYASTNIFFNRPGVTNGEQEVWLPLSTNNFTHSLYAEYLFSYNPVTLRQNGTLKFMNSGRAFNYIYLARGTIDVNGQNVKMTNINARFEYVFVSSGSTTNYSHLNFNSGTIDFEFTKSNNHTAIYQNTTCYTKGDAATNSGRFRIMTTQSIGYITYVYTQAPQISLGIVPFNLEIVQTSPTNTINYVYLVPTSGGVTFLNNLTTTPAASGNVNYFYNSATNICLTGNINIGARSTIDVPNVLSLLNNVFSLPTSSTISINGPTTAVVTPAIEIGFDRYVGVARTTNNYILQSNSDVGFSTTTNGVTSFYGGNFNFNGYSFRFSRFIFVNSMTTLTAGTGGEAVSAYASGSTGTYTWEAVSFCTIVGNLTFRCDNNTSNLVSFLHATGSATNALSINRSAGTGYIFPGSNSYIRDFKPTATNAYLANNVFVSGDITLPAGATTAFVYLYLVGGATQAVTGNGVTANYYLSVQKTAGTQVVFNDNARFYYLESLTGDVNFNNFNCTITSNVISQAGGLKTFYMGTGTLTTSIFNVSTDSADVTIVPSTSTIRMSNAGSSTTFHGAGKTYNRLLKTGSGTLTINGSNTFNTIENETSPGTITFTSGTTQTVTDFKVSGTAGNLITINSSTPGSQATLYSVPDSLESCNYLSIRDSNATGTKYWYAGNNSTNVSNNSNWIFASPDDFSFSAFFG
jgi:hypothetical protein